MICLSFSHKTALICVLSSIVYSFIAIFSVLSISHVQASEQKNPTIETSAKQLEKVSLQLKWFHQFQFAGYYAAKEQGFYQAEGLDVDIIQRSKDTDEIDSVSSAEIDYAVADSSIIAGYANGEPITILAAIFQHDPLVFISKKTSKILTPYDLIGKRIMFDLSEGNEANLRSLLYLSNIKPDEYTHLIHNFNKDDLITGKVDVTSAYLTDQVYYYKKRGIDLNVIYPRNYGVDFYGDLLITSTQEIIDHPGRAERFKRASIKGWKYALSHKAEMIALIKHKYKSQLSLENLWFEAEETHKIIMPEQIPLGQVEVNRLRRVAEIYAQLKIAPSLSDLKLRKLVYGSSTQLSLSGEEQSWLAQHPIIRIGIKRDFAPFEWLDEEQNYLGINADYIRSIEEILGVQFEIVKDKNWQQTLTMLKAGELEMISGMHKSVAKENGLAFSKPYLSSNVAIIIDIKNAFITTLEQLNGKNIVLEEDYFVRDILARKYPDINVIPTPDSTKALQLLDLGIVDAYIGDEIYSNYIIQKTGMLNLRMSGRTEFRSQQRFAVSQKNSQLLSIIQKALDHISAEEKEQILNKWRGLHIEQGVQIEQLFKLGIAITSIFVLFIYWLYRLKKEVQQRKQMELALQKSEGRFRKIFEGTDAISVQGYNTKREVIYWNPASETLYGYDAKTASGKLLEDLIIPDEMKEPVVAGIENWFNGGEEIPSSELTLKRQDGSPVHVFSSHVLLHNQNNEAEMYCIDIDLTLRKEQADKIKHQAFFDNLTDLPNRLLALDRLSQLLNEARRNTEKVAVLFLDLDDFKKINDTLGHETGDMLLIEAAERLNSVLREGDTVGRLGGDEFILLLGGLASNEAAQPIAENLLKQFRIPFKIESRELILTASIGIALYPEDGKDSSELLRNADSAMYHAKKLGRNTYSYFTASMNQEVSRRLALEEQVHGALERNELEVFYQPKIAIESGKLVGAEALLRWHNPILGHVSPDEFIPICEQTSLIIAIGEFVLRHAMEQAVEWRQALHDEFYMAINLSPRQFRDPALVQSISDVIKQSGIQPEAVELEITEGVLMSGHQHISDALSALSDLGVTIAMDDFGTGYSSLSYLRSYPFNVLKIDRCFVCDIIDDPEDRALVNAVIAMAHGLKLKVVAEGVETEKQLALLKQMGCDIAQGYYYSQPVSAADFKKLFIVDAL